MSQRALAWLPAAWSLVLVLVLLGPALLPGYVLSYDMVWVPDLAVRPDVWGLGSGLPRAVPSDGVLALLDELVPGAVLQKLVLVGALVAGGTGASRLLPGTPGEHVAARVVAASAYVWTPFVAERLLLGAWPVIVAHGLLPWLVLLGRRWRDTGRLPPVLLVLVPLGCLSASAGVATAVVLLAAAVGPRRRTAQALALVAAGNAPWLATGLLHAADATSDRAGAEAFALQGHGVLPAPLEALVLGGTWNSEVVLPSRDGVLAWIGLAAVLALALALRGWWATAGRREALALSVPWGVGMTLALLTWAAPGLVADLAATVPGGGIFRDGARSLALCAPLVAALAAHATTSLVRRVTEPEPRAVLAVALALTPVVLLPDASFGMSSRLDAVAYPDSYALARSAAAAGVADVGGDVLVLPLASYRQPRWNGSHKVLDPMPRWLTSDAVASDRLVVGTTALAGEDPRVADAAAALAQPTPDLRAQALAGIGIGVVVVELDAGNAPDVAGRVLLEDPDFRVIGLGDVEERDVPISWVVAAAAGWGAYAAAPVLGLVLALGSARRRRRATGLPQMP